MKPANQRVVQHHATRRDPEIERLLQGRHHEPRSVLGVLPHDDENVVVRVLLPNALRVHLLEPAVELARIPGTALFEWTGPRASIATPYRIRWESHDGRSHEG